MKDAASLPIWAGRFKLLIFLNLRGNLGDAFLDSTGEKDSNWRLGLQCPVRQRWVVGAENEVISKWRPRDVAAA